MKTKFRNFAMPLLFFSAFAAIAPGITSQENHFDPDLKQRLESLEKKIDFLESRLQEKNAGESGGMGTLFQGVGLDTLGRLGQTTGFSNTFNPAIGFCADTLFAGSSKNDSGDAWNKFHLRSAEIGLSSHIDPYGYAYAVIEYHNEEHLGVPEAAGVLNLGPDEWDLRLKAGRLFSDFGKINQVHDHDLPFVSRPSVLEDYLGGSASGTGLELHQWFGLSDEIPLRWSLGVLSNYHGHSHALDKEHTHAADSDSYANFKDLAYTGRSTAFFELSPQTTMQIGVSGLYRPEINETHDSTRFKMAERFTGGIDMSLKWSDQAGRSSLVWGTEFLRTSGDFLDESVSPHVKGRDRSIGGYSYLLWSQNKHWSTYGIVDWHQEPGRSNRERIDLGCGVTWRISHFNQIRLHYEFRDYDGSEDCHVVYLQWVFIIGTHAHGMDW